MIYADTTTTDTVVADYTFRQTEEFFPSYFVMAVAYGLAQVFATSIARDGSLTQTMATLADAAMRKARSVDSQQQTSRKLATGRFVQNRNRNEKAEVRCINFQFGEVSRHLYREQIQKYIQLCTKSRKLFKS